MAPPKILRRNWENSTRAQIIFSNMFFNDMLVLDTESSNHFNIFFNSFAFDQKVLYKICRESEL